MEYTRYVYNRIHWLNKSDSLTTPLGKTNLNRMDSAIYSIAENLDIVNTNLSTGKLDKSDADKLIVGMPTWNPSTGILAFKFYDGTTFQVDFNVEKIPVSFSMDSSGLITMITSDGTEWTANIGDVVPDYTFADSDTIAMTDTKNGQYAHTVSAQVKKGSITGEYLQPDYLSDVTTQANNAKSSAQTAVEYASNATIDAKMAQSYAVGGSGIRDGEATDNSKYYKEKSEQAAQEAEEYLADLKSVQVTGVKGNAETTYRKGDVNLTPANIGALSLGGGTVTGRTLFNQGTRVGDFGGGSGTSGYMNLCQMKIIGNYCNQPIEFVILQRGGAWGTVRVCFSNASNTDPTLSSIKKTGSGINAYIAKSATSTWDLYIRKAEAYDNISVIELRKGGYSDNAITITWKNQTVTSLPSGYSEAVNEEYNGNAATASKLGTSTVGGTAKPIYLNGGSPTAISSTVGSATKPSYLNGGTVTACTYSLEKSVPSNAVFTDTTYPIAGKTINASFSTAFRTQTKGNTNSGDYLSMLRNDTSGVANSPQFGSGIAWGRGDTHGYLYVNYSSAAAYIGGGNADKLNWTKQLAFTDTATTSANGLMSSSDKSKLDGISAGANKTTVDSSLSSTSTNPVQNKAVNTALGNKASATWTKLTSLSKGGSATVPSTAHEILVQYANSASSSAIVLTFTFPYGSMFYITATAIGVSGNLGQVSSAGKVTADSALNGYLNVYYR